jgi:hypothetical protein
MEEERIGPSAERGLLLPALFLESPSFSRQLLFMHERQAPTGEFAD